MLFELINNIPDLSEMFLKFVFYYFTISSLHPLKILQRLIQLIPPIQNHNPRTLHRSLDVFDDLGHNLYLLICQILLIYTLSTQQILSLFLKRVDDEVILFALLIKFYARS